MSLDYLLILEHTVSQIVLSMLLGVICLIVKHIRFDYRILVIISYFLMKALFSFTLNLMINDYVQQDIDFTKIHTNLLLMRNI